MSCGTSTSPRTPRRTRSKAAAAAAAEGAAALLVCVAAQLSLGWHVGCSSAPWVKQFASCLGCVYFASMLGSILFTCWRAHCTLCSDAGAWQAVKWSSSSSPGSSQSWCSCSIPPGSAPPAANAGGTAAGASCTAARWGRASSTRSSSCVGVLAAPSQTAQPACHTAC
jgi:hypothetical protein